MKIKNKIIVSMFFLFLLLFITNICARDIVYDIKKDGTSLNTEGYSEEEAIEIIHATLVGTHLDAKTLDNIDKLSKFAARSFVEKGGIIGKIIVDENTKLITLETAEGKVHTQIPKGFAIKERQRDFSVSGKSETVSYEIKYESVQTSCITGESCLIDRSYTVTETPQLMVNGFTIKSDSMVDVSLTEIEGISRIELRGEGNIKGRGVVLEDLKNGILEVNKNNEVVFADFTALKKRTYEFDYKGIKYKFIAERDGRVIFDPKKGLIQGQQVSLSFGSYDDELYQFISQSTIKGDEFSVSIEDGQIKNIYLSRYGEFIDGNGNTYTSSEQFDIFLDGTDISEMVNAIAITEKGIFLKGKIEFSSENGLNYRGLEKDSYTNFLSEEKLFNVIKGDAEIDNGKHTVLVKDGEFKLFIENLDSEDYAESFQIRHTNKDGKEEWGIIDESLDGKSRLIIGIFDEKGNFKPMSGRRALTGDEIQRLELDVSIANLKAEISRLEMENPNSRELGGLKANLVIQESKKLIFDEDFDQAIEKIEEALQQDISSDVKESLMFTLGAYYRTRGNSYDNLPTSERLEGAKYTGGRGGRDLSVFAPVFFRMGVNEKGEKIVTGWSVNNKEFYSMDINPNIVFSLKSEDPLRDPSPRARLTDKNQDLIRELHDIYLDGGRGSYEHLQNNAKSRGKELINEGVITNRYYSRNYNLMTQDYEKAVSIFQDLKASSSSGSETYNYASLELAQTHLSSGDYNKAYQEYDQLQLNYLKDDVFKSRAYYGMAVASSQMQQYFQSLRESKKSSVLDPNNQEALLLRQQLRLNGLAYTYSKLGRESRELFALTEGTIGIKRALSVATSNDQIVYTYKDKSTQLTDLQAGITGWSMAIRAGKDEEFKQGDFRERQIIMSEIFGVDADDGLATRFAEKMGSAMINPDVIMILNDGDAVKSERYLAERSSGFKAPKKWGIISGEYVDEYKQIFNEPRFISGKRIIDPGVLNDPWDKALTEVNLINAALLVGPGIPVTVGGRTLSVASWVGRGLKAGVARLPTAARLAVKGASRIPARIGATIGEMRLVQKMPSLTRFTVGELFESTIGGVANILVPGSGLPTEVLLGRAEIFSRGITASVRRAFFNNLGASKKIILTAGETGIEGVEGRMFKSKKALQSFLGKVEGNKIKGIKKLGDNLVEIDGRRVLVYADGSLPAKAGDVDIIDSMTPSQLDIVVSADLATIQAKYGKRVKTLRKQVVQSYGMEGVGGGVSVQQLPVVAEQSISGKVFFNNLGTKSAELAGRGKLGMIEKIMVDSENIPLEFRRRIVDEFDRTIGKLDSYSSVKEIDEAVHQFSTSMHESLPFLGYDNLVKAREEIANQRALFYEYLRLTEQGTPKLSQLISSKQLDCNGQALAVREALGGDGSGWNMFHDTDSGGDLRVHAFLAKEFEFDGKKYVMVIDPSEVNLYKKFGDLPPAGGYGKSNSLVMEAEDFYRRSYVPADMRSNFGKVFSPDEIDLPTTTIPQVRRDYLEYGPHKIQDVAKLSDVERLHFAESRMIRDGLLAESLTDVQKKQILAAHYTEVGSSYTRISKKARILSDFTPEQRRLLMKTGITGTDWTPNRMYARLMTPEEARLFDQTGRLISVESGELVPVMDVTTKKRLIQLATYSRSERKQLHKAMGGDGGKYEIRFFRSQDPPIVERIPLRNTPNWITETKFEGEIEIKIE